MRRTQKEWQALIQSQACSGLTATEFCKQHGLDDKYFSLRKNKLRQPLSESAFVPAVRTSEASATGKSSFTLTYGDSSIQFYDAPPAVWLATLIRALS